MKRLLSIALALMMLSLSISAVAEGADPYGKYDEPITITILSKDFKTGTTNYDSTDPTRKSATENAWVSAYEEYLNIKVVRIIAEDDVALNALVNTGMASGDLPDVMLVGKEMFYTLVENEVAQDLLPAFEAYAQKNYLAAAADADMLSTGMVDGKLLGFPIANNWYNSTQLLWLRQDWLDALGLKPPATIDEMLDIARAFKEAKLGGEDTIGLGIAGVSGGTNSSYDFRGILAAYGAIYGAWMQQEDGTYVYGAVSDGVKDGLNKLQEVYAEGLIKPDFAVSQILAEEVANDQVGMYYATAWHSVTDIKTNMVNNPDAEWVCVSAPSVDGDPMKQFTNASVGEFAVVNVDCEYPEAIMKMMELEQKVYTNPSDEEIPKLYAAEDNFLLWDLRIFRNFGRTDFDLYRSKLINEHLAKGSTVDDVEPVIKDFYSQIEQALAGDRAFYGRYLCQTMAYPIDAQLLEAGLLVPGYNGPLTETMQLYQSTILTELDNAMIKVVMGEDISVYEKAVEDWYKNGGQTITDEVNAYYAQLQ